MARDSLFPGRDCLEAKPRDGQGVIGLCEGLGVRLPSQPLLYSSIAKYSSLRLVKVIGVKYY